MDSQYCGIDHLQIIYQVTNVFFLNVLPYFNITFFPKLFLGPIQLWQFLLELLSDKTCESIIRWTGEYLLNNLRGMKKKNFNILFLGQGWEFKLADPDEVSYLYV